MTLTIHKWNDIFENADTRKRERLKYFHAPSGNDSRGYIALVSRFPHDQAMMAFGVFQALCQLSATLGKSVRGAFKNSDGTSMDIQQLSVLLRVKECQLSAAIEILTDQRVAWLKWDGVADNLPVTCQSHPAFVQGEGKGEGQGEDSNLSHKEAGSPPNGKHEIPTVDEVKRYAGSAPVPISVACAIAFHDTQEAGGWVTKHGHPIADWRAALRRYASLWNQNEQRAGPRSPSPKPGHSNGYGETSSLD